MFTPLTKPVAGSMVQVPWATVDTPLPGNETVGAVWYCAPPLAKVLNPVTCPPLTSASAVGESEPDGGKYPLRIEPSRRPDAVPAVIGTLVTVEVDPEFVTVPWFTTDCETTALAEGFQPVE